MSSKKVFNDKSSVSYIDSETGEVLQKNVVLTNYYINKRDKFMTIHNGSLDMLFTLSEYEIKVLFYLMNFYDYQSKQLVVNKMIKEKLSVLLKTNIPNISNYICKINNKGILFRVSKGVYNVNRKIFWTGRDDK